MPPSRALAGVHLYTRAMRRHRRCQLLAVLVVGAMAAVACGSDDAERGTADTAEPTGSVPEWPAPDDPMARTAEAGLTPAVKEHLQTHRHSHLDVFVDGEP